MDYKIIGGTKEQAIPFPDKRYDIIYADPPWEYRQSGSRSAAEHYPTMSTEEICQLPVQTICGGGGAVCLMWATFPNIGEALKVMESWGFQYKTAAFVGVKKYAKSGKNFFWNGRIYEI